MDLGLAGRAALVSGASSGLGLASARALAAEGAKVAMAARNPARLERAAQEVAAAGDGDVLAVPLDVRDAAAVRAWVEQAVARFGALHVVVANAGGPPPGPPSAFGVDEHRAALELSLLGLIGLVDAALPHLRAAGWGRVLLVASETVKQPTATYALSSTARAGLVGYAKTLVDELGPGEITVNVLAPGYHRTEPVERMAGPHGLARFEAKVPLGRLGRPEDFGAVAAFLASQPAGFITGSVVLVDGGATKGF